MNQTQPAPTVAQGQPPITPLPWIAMGFPQTNGWDIAHQDAEGHTSHIAHLPPYIGNQSNAVLIIRAVNSHAALVAACEAAVRLSGHLRDVAVKSDRDNAYQLGEIATELYDKSYAALALAKGGDK